jgi:RimJ/RimL family protein N-acetyltransferase
MKKLTSLQKRKIKLSLVKAIFSKTNSTTISLETERLILKKLELSDISNLVPLRADIEVMHYTGEGAVQTRKQVEEYLNFIISYFEKYGLGFYLVFEKESGSFIGEAGLFHLLFDDTQSEIEINYHLKLAYKARNNKYLNESLITLPGICRHNEGYAC